MSELLSTLDPRRTAFLTLDVQTALVGFYAKEDFLGAVRSLLACARNLNATGNSRQSRLPAGFSGGQREEPSLLSPAKNPDYAKMLNTPSCLMVYSRLGGAPRINESSQSPASVLLKALIWRFCSGRKA